VIALSIVYRKKAFILKIPLYPPFPKGDNMKVHLNPKRILPTHFHDEPILFYDLAPAYALIVSGRGACRRGRVFGKKGDVNVSENPFLGKRLHKNNLTQWQYKVKFIFWVFA
jgi:hypothetical protein